MTSKKDNRGITAEKDEFSEWFTQIMLKADLADYTAVSGCIVFKPTAYEIWENLKEAVDGGYRQLGIRNAYFPLFIPEKFLNKEKEHVAGFSPEVAWVTHAGNTKLNERLAIRPTSETIMYPSISKWVRSYRDLPLKLNQWNNVVRWEFKNPIPFLRTREFLWSEGHTAFSNQKEAEQEGKDIIELYDAVCREVMALPSLIGRKTEKEKFAGAEYTISMEFYMPNGKAIQGPDFHHDGQKFAKAFDIQFVDEKEKKQYVYQNTFAISTRMLGVMFAIHSDEKGLVIPPMIAPDTIAIVPIFDDKNKKMVLKEAERIADELEDFGVILDDREEYRPGFKFNEYELKGIPLRIEIGPRDLEKDSVMVVRRDTGDKESVKITSLKKYVEKTLTDIQSNLLKRAEKMLKGAVISVGSLNGLIDGVKNRKICLVDLCSSVSCEEDLKHKTNGAKVLNIDDKKNVKGKCVICSKKAVYVGRVGKSY
jgi:prolyl-tRNA synthetase